ncbi:MAG: hypothetical protein U0892_03410 [Pirellulales bacterium]
MSNINFFSWIRDGVRQSVLLGVSDAIDQLGTPPSTDELHPDVVAFLQSGASSGAATAAAPKLAGHPRTGQNGRKRLGRSLKEIENETQK